MPLKKLTLLYIRDRLHAWELLGEPSKKTQFSRVVVSTDAVAHVREPHAFVDSSPSPDAISPRILLFSVPELMLFQVLQKHEVDVCPKF